MLRIEKYGLHVGNTAPSEESEAHRRLKLYIATNPRALELSSKAVAEMEHKFITENVVDVLFINHGPLRTVAEVELEGSHNIIVGIRQAIKYRSLAETEAKIDLYDQEDLNAYVVSYEPGGEEAFELAAAYNVKLVNVEKI